jgi:hypothetical protein
MEGIIGSSVILVFYLIGTFRYLNGKATKDRKVLLIACIALIIVSVFSLLMLNDHPEPFYMPKNAKYTTANIISKAEAPRLSSSEMRHNGLIKLGKYANRSTTYYRLDITYKFTINGQEYVKQGSVRGRTYAELENYGNTVDIVYNAKNPTDAGVVGEEGQIIRINYYLNYVVIGYCCVLFVVILKVQPKNKKGK